MRKIMFCIFILVFLAACGGGSSSNNDNVLDETINETSKVEGKLVDLDGAAIVGAVVKLSKSNDESRRTKKDIIEYQGTSNEKGIYSIEINSLGKYRMTVEADNYMPLDCEEIELEEGATVYIEEIAQIPSSYIGEKREVNFKVFNVVTGEEEEDVLLKLMEGMNVKNGEIVKEAISNIDGVIQLESIDMNYYTAKFSKEGYTDIYRNISGISEDELKIYISPELSSESQIRIVLSWEKTPDDLDSHLIFPLSTGATGHMFYMYQGEDGIEDYQLESELNSIEEVLENNRDLRTKILEDKYQGYEKMLELMDLEIEVLENEKRYLEDMISVEGDIFNELVLDLDNIDILYDDNPETITVLEYQTGKTYKYFIDNFARDDNLKNSKAKVTLYFNNEVKVFNVPVNKEGIVWEVFEIRDNNVYLINKILDEELEIGILSLEKEEIAFDFMQENYEGYYEGNYDDNDFDLDQSSSRRDGVEIKEKTWKRKW